MVVFADFRIVIEKFSFHIPSPLTGEIPWIYSGKVFAANLRKGFQQKKRKSPTYPIHFFSKGSTPKGTLVSVIIAVLNQHDQANPTQSFAALYDVHVK